MQTSAEIVDRIGLASFYSMSTLILVCIAFGFFAVYDSYKQPTWQEACITQGGIPIQKGKLQFDCKFKY